MSPSSGLASIPDRPFGLHSTPGRTTVPSPLPAPVRSRSPSREIVVAAHSIDALIGSPPGIARRRFSKPDRVRRRVVMALSDHIDDARAGRETKGQTFEPEPTRTGNCRHEHPECGRNRPCATGHRQATRPDSPPLLFEPLQPARRYSVTTVNHGLSRRQFTLPGIDT